MFGSFGNVLAAPCWIDLTVQCIRTDLFDLAWEEQFPHIKHSYDIRHAPKNLWKKLYTVCFLLKVVQFCGNMFLHGNV